MDIHVPPRQRFRHKKNAVRRGPRWALNPFIMFCLRKPFLLVTWQNICAHLILTPPPPPRPLLSDLTHIYSTQPFRSFAQKESFGAVEQRRKELAIVPQCSSSLQLNVVVALTLCFETQLQISHTEWIWLNITSHRIWAQVDRNSTYLNFFAVWPHFQREHFTNMFRHYRIVFPGLN